MISAALMMRLSSGAVFRSEDVELTWVPDPEDPWDYIHGEGHDARGYYGIKRSEKFHFVYSPIWGIQAIEYRKDLINHELYKDSSDRFLPCKSIKFAD